MKFHIIKFDHQKFLLLLLIFLFPIILLEIMSVTEGIDLSACIPINGDELWWWQQAAGTSKYGYPLGYFGYNGGTAKIGTFAAWGPAIVLPYAIWGRVFGWNFSSYIFANCFYMGISATIFCLLLRLKKKQLIKILVLEALMFVKIYFSLTAMAECVRYAMGIVALALIIYLYDHEDINKMVQYVCIPAYLLYISLSYQIFSIFFFLWTFILLKRKNIILRFIGSGIVLLGVVWITGKILRLFTSPYITSGQQLNVLDRIKGNLTKIIQTVCEENIFFKWYYLFIVLLLIILIIIFAKGESEKIRFRCFIGIVLLMTFIGGHVALYAASAWTFVRGLNVAAVLVVYILCISVRKKEICAVAIFLLLGYYITGSCAFSVIVTDQRMAQEATQMYLKRTRSALENIIKPEKKAEPWENTIATYCVQETYLSLVVPAGISSNEMMIQGVYNTDTKYAALGKNVEEKYFQETKATLQDIGYKLVYENEKMLILKK